ncbi:uncharacterized protein L969DRAFT_97034 [Mixia osmundae IAM 14324]|uniref:Uncharacterized protein n=1 Tax=Mixia osmundae (strain CBS 9802 / IAM 14324 / JCM 22182 / KY 12970) TaxID=764103 RepID=G7E1G8_MIXOS|nr:uncharacterized protein L969DRAFT_97034 [Mixia osmundae IAM 14324]KEI36632.1 hypothetical protein L969DRAFT_97034 [Mixia osmundae IAM 14324]GAA96678.1 hypothetical protein E5Q_03349 [Mixia osmundae IAM 14324]
MGAIVSVLDRTAVANLTGALSIAAWLGVVFPQVVANYRNKSVEGLSLPFLLSWLAGDLTNLAGCLLTHQLPFQTWLASYFCVVDLCLMSQYIYYARQTSTFDEKLLFSAPSEVYPEHRHLRRRTSSERGARLGHGKQRPIMPKHTYSGSTVTSPPTHGEPLDASVATLTSIVSYASTPSVEANSRGRHDSRDHALSHAPTSRRATHLGQSADEASPATLQSTRTFSSPAQGRRAQRAVSKQKAKTMVFLSVAAVLGLRQYNAGPSARSISYGEAAWTPAQGWVVRSTSPSSNWLGTRHRKRSLAFPSTSDGDAPDEDPQPALDTQRIIGRVSAWVCATLYLTSRCPQIYQNYRRRSVEGLAMLLFVAAFMGNLFYVISILVDPSTDLRESLPFLIGSGGTLCFDVTIVAQSYIYDPNRKPMRKRAVSRRLASSVTDLSQTVAQDGPHDEEAGLLSMTEDTDDDSHTDDWLPFEYDDDAPSTRGRQRQARTDDAKRWTGIMSSASRERAASHRRLSQERSASLASSISSQSHTHTRQNSQEYNDIPQLGGGRLPYNIAGANSSQSRTRAIHTALGDFEAGSPIPELSESGVTRFGGNGTPRA